MSHLPLTPDDQFLKLLDGNDVQALRLLFDEYYDIVFDAVSKFIPSNDDSDEIIHQLFYDIWLRRGRLNISRPVYKYLLKSALNRSRNFLRSRKRLKEIFTSPAAMREFDERASPVSADSALNIEDINRLLAIARNRMSSRVRLAYSLSRNRNMTYPQIADLMGISIKTVEKNISTALGILYEVFRQYLQLLILVSSACLI